MTISRRTRPKPKLVCTPDHRYFIDKREIPGNTAILRASGYGQEQGGWGDLQRGRHVHLACRYLTEGRLRWATVEDRLLPYVAGWGAFLKISGFAATPGWIERPTYCRRYDFATRPDIVGRLNGQLALVQIKTGSADPSVGPQTAGEALAVEDVLGARPERFVVMLPGNGRFKIKRLVSRADRPAFLAALATWQNRRRMGWNGREARH